MLLKKTFNVFISSVGLVHALFCAIPVPYVLEVFVSRQPSSVRLLSSPRGETLAPFFASPSFCVFCERAQTNFFAWQKNPFFLSPCYLFIIPYVLSFDLRVLLKCCLAIISSTINKLFLASSGKYSSMNPITGRVSALVPAVINRSFMLNQGA